MVVAGRRSGKTESAKRKLIASLWDCAVNPRPWDDPRFFAAAPTRDQAKKIWWQDLKALTPKWWLDGKPSESELIIRTVWGAELHVVGLNVPERMEGTSWDGGMADEFANAPVGLFDNNILPALGDREGWMWFIGVPDKDAKGQVWYQKMVNYCRSGVDPKWESFTWPSADILPAHVVADAKKTMDPRVFEQEMLGKFILSGGRAFPDFEYLPQYPVLDADGRPMLDAAGRPMVRPGRHIRPCPYRPDLPLCWSLDFNIADGKPACSGVIQYDKAKGEVYVIHEFAVDGVSTNVVADVFLEEAKRRRWDLSKLELYGDATGGAKDSTSGTTDWYILKNRLKNFVSGGRVKDMVPSANPSVKDTINAVNAKVSDANGVTRLFIDPSLVRPANERGEGGIINDLNNALWPDDLEPFHSVSWLRYFVDARFPVLISRDEPAGVARSPWGRGLLG